MLSTRQILVLLQAANPGVRVSEEDLRYAIRRGDIQRPQLFCGRLAWTLSDVAVAAAALGLVVPEVAAGERTTP